MAKHRPAELDDAVDGLIANFHQWLDLDADLQDLVDGGLLRALPHNRFELTERGEAALQQDERGRKTAHE